MAQEGADPYFDHLKEELTCSLCLELLKEPKSLIPCPHTYCKPCILEYKVSKGSGAKLPCPLCKNEIIIDDIDQLPTNFVFINLLESYKEKIQVAEENKEKKL